MRQHGRDAVLDLRRNSIIELCLSVLLMNRVVRLHRHGSKRPALGSRVVAEIGNCRHNKTDRYATRFHVFSLP